MIYLQIITGWIRNSIIRFLFQFLDRMPAWMLLRYQSWMAHGLLSRMQNAALNWPPDEARKYLQF